MRSRAGRGGKTVKRKNKLTEPGEHNRIQIAVYVLKHPAVSVYQRWGETKLRLAMLPVAFIKTMTVLGFLKISTVAS